MSPDKVLSTDGFTLVELLASLTVLAMLSLMILAGVGGRSLAWRRMNADTARGETVEATQALLRHRIETIVPVTLYNIVPPGPDFDGEGERAVFLSQPPSALGPGAIWRYQLALDAQGDLVLDSRSDVALDQHHWSDRQVLLHGVQSLDLAYFGALASNRGPDWQAQWVRQPFMPSLVRIRLDFPPGDRRRWPDLIVHPATDMDVFCKLSSATGGCIGR
jgi:general secretion pathway protein J